MKNDISIKQGSTFSMVVKYASPKLSVANITGITKSGQAIVTAAGHGIPSDWLVWVVGVVGMVKINHQPSELRSVADAYYAYYNNSNSLQLDLDTTRYSPYESGGELLFHPPIDLTGYTARMQIRESVESTTAIHELTTSSGIALGGAAGTITLSIPAVTTAGFGFDAAVYDLEIVSGSGVVTSVSHGAVTLVREVTR